MRVSAKTKAKAVDKMIERAFYRTSSGVQINVLDIGKIFAAGRKAHAESGGSEAMVESAVVAAVAALRVN